LPSLVALEHLEIKTPFAAVRYRHKWPPGASAGQSQRGMLDQRLDVTSKSTHAG
jgi:hypothetical protein